MFLQQKQETASAQDHEHENSMCSLFDLHICAVLTCALHQFIVIAAILFLFKCLESA